MIEAGARWKLTRRGALSGAAWMLAAQPGAAAVIDFTVIGKDGWLFATFDDIRRVDVARMHATTRLVGDGVAMLKRAGIETVVALTASKSRTYREFLPPDFQFSPEGLRRYGAMLELLRATNTMVPDLATPLLEHRAAHPADLLFLKADTHWNAAGAEIAAIELAREVKARFNLGPSSRPGTKLGGTVIARQGRNDLADGLPEAMGAKYPSETFPIREVLQTGGAASLIEEDTADVLVVGNSFMQTKYGFAAMLSNQLDRPVSLVSRVHQASPYKTLVGVLGENRFKRAKPKLLVWNFAETDMVTAPDQAGAWGPNAMTSQAFLGELATVLRG